MAFSARLFVGSIPGYKGQVNHEYPEKSIEYLHCLNCNFELHADLNATKNIGVFGKYGYLRLASTSQSLRPVPLIPDSNKPPAIAGYSLALSHIYFNGKTF